MIAPTTLALIGRLGTPQLACLRSWRRAGIPCVFLHADTAPLPRPAAALLGVRCVVLGPLQLDDPAYVERLSRHLLAEGVDALTCVSEPIAEALWACRSDLPPGLRIAAARPAQTLLLRSKVVQDRLARHSGLHTLESWTLPAGGRADAVPAEAFPLAVRPDVARRALPPFKVEVVHDRRALQRLVDRQRPGSSALIAQPLVHGPNLLVHAWRSEDGRRAGHVAFKVDLKHRGLTVRMAPQALDPALADGCATMARSLGLCGVFHFEFIIDERSGRACFLDLNPRLGGTTGKALAAGYDEPLALLATLGAAGLPDSAFVAPTLRKAGGLHQALRAAFGALRGTSTDADFPWPDRGRLWRALAGQWLVRDELLAAGGLRSLLAFALCQIAQRLPGARPQAAERIGSAAEAAGRSAR